MSTSPLPLVVNPSTTAALVSDPDPQLVQPSAIELEAPPQAMPPSVPSGSTDLDADDWSSDPLDDCWEWLEEPAPSLKRVSRELLVMFPDGRSAMADAHDLALVPGDRVLLEAEDGTTSAKVCSNLTVRLRSGSLPVRILRRETPGDQRRRELQIMREAEAFRFCKEKILERRLDMKLLRVVSQPNGNRTIFYFGSEGRVDFRSLVRDLAQRFHTRIEMRQIGVRDEARLLGGLGCCGLPLCCNAFLAGFAPVSIRMAKTQNLSLNPQKVSGQCSRLLCCLNYEQKAYEELRRGLPRMGATVETPRGFGRVRELDVLRRRVRVQLETGQLLSFQVLLVPAAPGSEGSADKPLVRYVEFQPGREGASAHTEGATWSEDLPELSAPDATRPGLADEEPRSTLRETLTMESNLAPAPLPTRDASGGGRSAAQASGRGRQPPGHPRDARPPGRSGQASPPGRPLAASAGSSAETVPSPEAGPRPEEGRGSRSRRRHRPGHPVAPGASTVPPTLAEGEPARPPRHSEPAESLPPASQRSDAPAESARTQPDGRSSRHGSRRHRRSASSAAEPSGDPRSAPPGSDESSPRSGGVNRSRNAADPRSGETSAPRGNEGAAAREGRQRRRHSQPPATLSATRSDPDQGRPPSGDSPPERKD